MPLSPYELWMVESNLARIAAGEANSTATVAILRANGYDRVADAVEQGAHARERRDAQLWAQDAKP